MVKIPHKTKMIIDEFLMELSKNNIKIEQAVYLVAMHKAPSIAGVILILPLFPKPFMESVLEIGQ